MVCARSRKVRDSRIGEKSRGYGGGEEFGDGKMGRDEVVVVICERGQFMRAAGCALGS
jgi:hypothetical protein